MIPGDESAGESHGTRSLKGNKNMRQLLNRAAQAAVKVKGSIFDVTFQAYALLNLYRHTGEAIWLWRACDLSRNAAEAAMYASSRESRELALRPESLHKGELGIIVLDSDLNHPEFARMPMFES